MARTARSLHARKKRRKVLEQAKGYRGTKNSSYKRAKEQVWKSGVYAYQGRKQRKRDFRALWIQRINAGARENGLSYSQFMHGIKLAEIDLDRKILADLAATEPDIFAGIVAQAQNALDGNPVEMSVKVERTSEAIPPPRKSRPRRQKPVEEPAPASTPTPAASATPAAAEETPAEETEVDATDAAEQKAEELDVDITEVEGSGQEGRVLVDDVEEAADEQGKINATDAAEQKAKDLGVDLATVEGTGANGRITVGDVEKASNAS